MAVSECGADRLDETAQEKKTHGTYAFPLAIYRDLLEREPVDWHWHMELELILVVSGEGTILCNGAGAVLGAGQGVFINSGTLHSCRVQPCGSCEIHSIVFHPRLISGGSDTVFWSRYLQPLTESGQLPYLCFGPDSRPGDELAALTGRAWESMKNEPEGYEFSVRSDLSRLIFILYQMMQQKAAEDPVREGSAGDIRKICRLKTMMEYIQANYTEEIRIADLAASALVSESECQRCFKSVLHTTPVKYLMNVRLQKAEELLAGTPLPAARIAELSGFPDNSYFGKIFKKETGMTPMEYRERHRR